MNSRRAFSESNIGGWDYLRNMVQLPFYLQNSALRRVKTAQAIATKRMQVINSDDFSTSLQRSVSNTIRLYCNAYTLVVNTVIRFLTLMVSSEQVVHNPSLQTISSLT